MSDWYALSGNDKWPWVVTKDVTFQTGINGVSFSHKYFELDVYGELTVKAGYMWNGCTGVPLWFEMKYTAMVEGSCPHDVLYQAMQLKLLPVSFLKVVDKLLKKEWLKRGLKKYKACTGYSVVRLVGWTRI